MDNKNVFVAIALSMSVLLFWAAFFETPKQTNKVSSQKNEQIKNENNITPNISNHRIKVKKFQEKSQLKILKELKLKIII